MPAKYATYINVYALLCVEKKWYCSTICEKQQASTECATSTRDHVKEYTECCGMARAYAQGATRC